ncbi:hypothetical protein IJ531_03725 [bacterium]|nr:hypothetical protein [bacterium]
MQHTQWANPDLKKQEPQAQEPIVLDNRAFDIIDGDKKSLDYLDYSGTIAKGTLAASGVIKLCPECAAQFKHSDYMTPPIKRQLPPVELLDEPIENEWDNIFALSDEGRNDIEATPEEENFFRHKPPIDYMAEAYAC